MNVSDEAVFHCDSCVSSLLICLKLLSAVFRGYSENPSYRKTHPASITLATGQIVTIVLISTVNIALALERLRPRSNYPYKAVKDKSAKETP